MNDIIYINKTEQHIKSIKYKKTILYINNVHHSFTNSSFLFKSSSKFISGMIISSS